MSQSQEGEASVPSEDLADAQVQEGTEKQEGKVQETGTGAGEAEGPASPKAPKADWKDRQLAKKNQQLAEERIRVAKLQEELETFRKNKPEGEGKPAAAPALSEEEIERRAEELASKRELHRQEMAVVKTGNEAYPDFQSSVLAMHRELVANDPKAHAAYQQLISAAMDMEQPHEVLYKIAKDMDLAERLLGLSPTKLGIEMARLGQGEARVEGSRRPPPASPLRPVGGKGASLETISPSDPALADKLSSAEWHRRRKEEIEKKESFYTKGAKARG